LRKQRRLKKTNKRDHFLEAHDRNLMVEWLWFFGIFWCARGISGVEPNNTGGRYTWSFRFSLIDACRLPVGRLRGQSLHQSRRGWIAVARAFTAALRRAGNGPSHDHVTTWRSGLCSARSLVCQYAQTTLALYVLLRLSLSLPYRSYIHTYIYTYIYIYIYICVYIYIVCCVCVCVCVCVWYVCVCVCLPAQCIYCLPHARIIHPYYARGRVRTRLPAHAYRHTYAAKSRDPWSVLRMNLSVRKDENRAILSRWNLRITNTLRCRCSMMR